MSKARLVITALFVDHQTPAEVAARYGVHRAWVYKLKARYDAEGEAALRTTVPTPEYLPDRDPAGHRRAGPAAAQATDRRRPGRRRRHHRLAPDPPPPAHGVAGHHQPDPGPRRHCHPRPDEATEVLLHPVRSRACPTSAGSPTSPTTDSPAPTADPAPDIEIITWLDDHSRYALHVTAHRRVTGPIVLATFRQAADLHGYPASTLTDNGMVYTTRLAGGRGGRNAFEHELRRLGIVQKNSRPEPPHHLRQGRTLPADPQEVAPRPTRPADHHRRTTDPPRRLPRRVQPPTPAPLTPAPSHPRDRLHSTPQSHPGQRPQHRHPRPDPPRQDQQGRQRHPARRRPATPHRRRPNLRRNLRPPARPRPRRPRRQRRHRRTPPRAHHRPPTATTNPPDTQTHPK